MADSKLRIVLSLQDKATGALKKFGRGVDSVGKKVNSAKKKMDGLTKTSKLLGGAVGIFAANKLANMGRELLDLGIKMDRAETALGAFAGGARQAEKAIKAVTDAAGGAISRMDAAQNATRLFSMGLANNAEEAANLTEIAITLGATMGKGPQQAFEEFTLLLANQSILRLDTFGISGGRVRERMAELAKEMPNATRETRFLTAVMEEAGGKMTDLEEAGFEAVSSVDQLSAHIADLKIGLGQMLAEGLVPVLDTIFTTANAVDALREAFEQGLITQEEYGEVIFGMRHGLISVDEAMLLVNQRQGEYTASLQAASSATDGWAASLIGVGAAAAEAEASLAGVVVSTRELEAASIGQAAIKELDAAVKEGTISQEEYDLAAREVMSTLLGMPASQIDANFALRALTTGFREGKASADEFVTGAQQLRSAIDRLESKKITIDVDFNIEGAPGGEFGFQHGGSFVVGGQGGADSQLVAFKATPGERVTVDQSDQSQNFGPFNFTNEIEGQALVESLKTQVRRM